MSSNQTKQLSPKIVGEHVAGQQTVEEQKVDKQADAKEADVKQAVEQTHTKVDKQEPEQIEQVKVNEVLVDEEEVEEEKFIQEDQQRSREFKELGNQLFKEQKSQLAIPEYQKALKYTKDPAAKAVLYSNISICYLRIEFYPEAENYCNAALKQDPAHKKARINLARCLEHSQKYEEALEEYKKASQADSHDQFIKQRMKAIQPKVDQINEKRKEEVISGLKNIGNSVLGYFGMSLDNFKLEKGEGGGYNIQFKQ